MTSSRADLDFANGILYKVKPLEPRICTVGTQKVVSVKVCGDPNLETGRLMPYLYPAAYAVRKLYKDMGLVYTVDKLRGRWPNSNHGKPKTEWVGKYALPVPKSTISLPSLPENKQDPNVNIILEDWEYGMIGQILHIGSFDTEPETLRMLHSLVAKEGYKINQDSHEEIYLSDPRKTTPENMKTLIIYKLTR